MGSMGGAIGNFEASPGRWSFAVLTGRRFVDATSGIYQSRALRCGRAFFLFGFA
jgi:hypothetical protein